MCDRRARKAAGGYAPALECGSPSLREGSPAVLSLVARRETRFTHCVRCARTIATSQNTMRADARGHEPCAPRRRICRCRRTPTPGFAGTAVACAVGTPRALLCGGRYPVGATCGAARSGAPRSARAARSSTLTRRDCSSATNEVSEASFAARPRPSSAAESARRADRHSRSPPGYRPPRRAELKQPLTTIKPRTSRAAHFFEQPRCLATLHARDVVLVLQQHAERVLDHRGVEHQGVELHQSARPLDGLGDARLLVQLHLAQPLHEGDDLLRELLCDTGHTALQHQQLASGVWETDPVVQATALDCIVDLARAVGGQHHDRRRGCLYGAELGNRDLELRQHLEQKGFERLVGTVELVDQQHRRHARAWGRWPAAVRVSSGTSPRTVHRPGPDDRCRCLRPNESRASGGRSSIHRPLRRDRGLRSTAAGSARARAWRSTCARSRSCQCRARLRGTAAAAASAPGTPRWTSWRSAT